MLVNRKYYTIKNRTFCIDYFLINKLIYRTVRECKNGIQYLIQISNEKL